MNNIVKTFPSEERENKYVYPLFGFAVEDYYVMSGIYPGVVIGTVLEEYDTEGDISSFIKEAKTESIDIFIFDIRFVSDEKCEMVRNYFKTHEKDYEEISDVYEDRIVFGKKTS